MKNKKTTLIIFLTGILINASILVAQFTEQGIEQEIEIILDRIQTIENGIYTSPLEFAELAELYKSLPYYEGKLAEYQENEESSNNEEDGILPPGIAEAGLLIGLEVLTGALGCISGQQDTDQKKQSDNKKDTADSDKSKEQKSETSAKEDNSSGASDICKPLGDNLPFMCAFWPYEYYIQFFKDKSIYDLEKFGKMWITHILVGGAHTKLTVNNGLATLRLPRNLKVDQLEKIMKTANLIMDYINTEIELEDNVEYLVNIPFESFPYIKLEIISVSK